MFRRVVAWFGLSFVHPHPEFRTGSSNPRPPDGGFFSARGKEVYWTPVGMDKRPARLKPVATMAID